MKAPIPLPADLRMVERHTFLASVDSELRLTLRDRSETPGVHLLVVYTDPDERFAEVCGVGPAGDYADLREATRSSPTRLGLRYVVPCLNCPQHILPKGCATTGFPISLLKLLPPPIIPESRAQEPRKAPILPPQRNALRMEAPGRATSPFAMTARPRPDEWHELGTTKTASVATRDYHDAEAALKAREAAIDARERHLVAMKLELEEEGVRLNEDLTVREGLLTRREQSLQAKLDALAVILREFDGLSDKIGAIARYGVDPIHDRSREPS